MDELIAKLEEIDKLLRQELAKQLKNGNKDNCSAEIAALLRARADVQSAITNLLGASA